MQEYLNKGKEVLQALIRNGYEAYFIGSAVRNIILDLPFDTIEITTSATPEAIIGIFNSAKTEQNDDEAVKLTFYGYVFYISTFLKEEYKDKRAPVKLHYSKNLLDELARRDFTINAIAMSHSGKLTDAYNGYEDIKKKRFKCIGKPRVRFTEKPIRMLRGISIVSQLNFKMFSKVKNAIFSKYKNIANVNKTLIAVELQKIIESKYSKKGLALIKNSRMMKYIPDLEKGFKFICRHTLRSYSDFIMISFILNQTIDEEYLSLVEDKVKFKQVFNLAVANPKSIFDVYSLFSNGEEICLEANRINTLMGRSKNKGKQIRTQYNQLPIHKVCDLKFKGEDILKLTAYREGEYIQIIIDDLIAKVITSEIDNDEDKLRVYTIEKLRELQIPLTIDDIDYNYNNSQAKAIDVPQVVVDEVVDTQQEVKTIPSPQLEIASPIQKDKYDSEMLVNFKRENQMQNDYTQYVISELERKIELQDRLLAEKDKRYEEIIQDREKRRIREDVNRVVDSNLEMLKSIKGLDSVDVIELRRQLQDVYQKTLEKGKNDEDK